MHAPRPAAAPLPESSRSQIPRFQSKFRRRLPATLADRAPWIFPGHRDSEEPPRRRNEGRTRRTTLTAEFAVSHGHAGSDSPGMVDQTGQARQSRAPAPVPGDQSQGPGRCPCVGARYITPPCWTGNSWFPAVCVPEKKSSAGPGLTPVEKLPIAGGPGDLSPGIAPRLFRERRYDP